MRRLIWTLAAALVALGSTSASQRIDLPGTADSVSFAVIGDNGSGDTPEYDVGRQMAGARDTFPFEFVIMLGDNMYGTRPRHVDGAAEGPRLLAVHGRLRHDVVVRLLWAGIHPALALIPIVSFLPHAPRTLDLFVDPPNDDDVHRFEHKRNEVVQVVLFLFGLVSAGVLMRGATPVRGPCWLPRSWVGHLGS